MKWHLIFIVTLMATLATGCGSGETAGDFAEFDEDEADSELVDGPAADVESPEFAEVEKFSPPFPTNRSFFSQPEVEKAVVAPDSYGDDVAQHANVRVIGFSQIEGGAPQALVSIQGNLRSVRSGDSVDGVTVVALDAPNLTLQQRNERWTVALFKQPVVNQYASATNTERSPRTATGRVSIAGNVETHQPNASSDVFSESGSFLEGAGKPFSDDVPGAISRTNLPPAPVALPADSFASEPELPEGLELPEDPTLPTIRNFEGTALPGLDEVPKLPTF